VKILNALREGIEQIQYGVPVDLLRVYGIDDDIALIEMGLQHTPYPKVGLIWTSSLSWKPTVTEEIKDQLVDFINVKQPPLVKVFKDMFIELRNSERDKHMLLVIGQKVGWKKVFRLNREEIESLFF
jgi:hypothetical protein